MQPTLQIDPRPFNAVMQDYARLNRRTFPEIVNAKGLDFAFRALKETPKAAAAEIRALPSQDWWPKFIAKQLGKGFTKEAAREFSRRVIGARLRAVAFVKSGWLPTIKRLWPIVKDRLFTRGSIQSARQYGVAKGSVRPAVAGDNPTAVLENSAMGVEKVGVAAAERAMDQVKADMAEYIARKLEGNARRVAR